VTNISNINATDYTKYSGGYYQFEEDKAKQAERGIWKQDD